MNVSIGPSSIAGWLTFAGAEAGFIGTAISGSEAQLHGPGKWLAILGVVALVLTNGGRQLQAALASKVSAVSTAPAELPTDAEEAAHQPPPVVQSTSTPGA